MTRGDRIIIATVLAAALLMAPQAGALLAPEVGSVVLRGPRGATEVDPSVSGRYVVEGRVGDVVFEISDGALRAVASDCPDQVCVHTGTAAAGRPVICAPNGVSAAVVFSREEELDAISR